MITVAKRYGQTDRQTTCSLITTLCVASRCKNGTIAETTHTSANCARMELELMWTAAIGIHAYSWLHIQVPRLLLMSSECSLNPEKFSS